MALKIEVESLEGIEEPFQSLYEETDGKYRLKVEGVDDTGALKRAKEHEKQARKEAEKRAKAFEQQASESEKALSELTQQIEAHKEEQLKREGTPDDIAQYRESLEKSWSEKLTKREAEFSKEIETLHNSLRTVLVDKEALKIASDLAVEGSAEILIPHIRNRLGVEERDGQHVTVVLDEHGRPSALTPDELKLEIKAMPAFAPVIAGSKATGGGAAQSANSGGGASQGGDLAKMTRQQKIEHFKNLRERGS